MNNEWNPISQLPKKDGYYILKLNNGKIITKYFIHDGMHKFYGVKLKDIESWKEK